MDVKELKKWLEDIPDGIDVVVIGRKDVTIGVSIPETEPVPKDWNSTNEMQMQRIPGYKRISIKIETPTRSTQ